MRTFRVFFSILDPLNIYFDIFENVQGLNMLNINIPWLLVFPVETYEVWRNQKQIFFNNFNLYLISLYEHINSFPIDIYYNTMLYKLIDTFFVHIIVLKGIYWKK